MNAGKRTSAKITGKEAELDSAFWGAEQHRTWEESESDSDVSFDIDEDEGESESDSELDEDEESEEESDEDESETDEVKKRKKASFRAYKPIAGGEAAPNRKTIVRRKPKAVPSSPKSVADSTFSRRETRDTTRARTQEVKERAEMPVRLRKYAHSGFEAASLSQEQLLEDARIVEEWNRADLDAYIKYTEMSEKERGLLLTRRRGRSNKDEYRIVARSFIEKGKVKSELKLIPPKPPADDGSKKKPQTTVVVKTTSQVLGIREPEVPPDRSMNTYRYPYGSMEGFNTREEYMQIREADLGPQRQQVESVIANLHSLLVKRT